MTDSFEHTLDASSANTGQASPLAKAMSRLLFPLARLCLANGVSFAVVEEHLKQAFVQEADMLNSEVPAHGKISRISTATGLTRREVTRLINVDAPARTSKPSVATELFARWKSDAAYQDHDGNPAVLKRLGPSPSFEALAQSITRDVHPRSILDELVRLGLVCFDEEQGSVFLTVGDFVPHRDAGQMLDFLGSNVGDHLNAAVANVLHGGNQHLEQAVFADELSSESLDALRPLFATQWSALRNAVVPVITELIESDRLAGRAQDRRIRIGLYSFDEHVGETRAANNTEKLPIRRYSAKGTKR